MISIYKKDFPWKKKAQIGQIFKNKILTFRQIFIISSTR
jgi:hypothetical protein